MGSHCRNPHGRPGWRRRERPGPGFAVRNVAGIERHGDVETRRVLERTESRWRRTSQLVFGE
jgi:hypothetical protein